MSVQNSSETGNRKDACKTYVEQTKLLVTLASSFLVAPAAFIVLFTGEKDLGLTLFQTTVFVISELAFVASVIAGYVVLGAITGSQHNGTYDVYRPATRISSLIQLALYVSGLAVFVWLICLVA